MSAKLTVILIAAGVAAAGALVTAGAEELSARAARLHEDAVVVDTHQDVPEALEEQWGAFANWRDIGEPGATKHVDIPRLRQGGVTAPFFVVYVPASYAERSEEHTSELQSPCKLVCRLLLEKKNNKKKIS